MATFMYALKLLLNVHKAVNTTFQERWIYNLLIEQA